MVGKSQNPCLLQNNVGLQELVEVTGTAVEVLQGLDKENHPATFVGLQTLRRNKMTERLHGAVSNVQVLDDEEVGRLEAMRESNEDETVEDTSKKTKRKKS